MKTTRILTVMLHSKFDNKRKLGRPRTRWIIDVENFRKATV